MKKKLIAILLFTVGAITARDFQPYDSGRIEKSADGQTRVLFTPGKLSGAQYNLTVEPGDYEIVAKIKGNGQVFAGACSDGWKFTPWWTLQPEFQEFKARVYIPKPVVTLALFGAGKTATATIAALELKKLDIPPLSSVEVPCTVLAAVDYAGTGAESIRGSVSARHAHAPLLRLPVPRTSLPLYLKLRCHGGARLRLDSCGQHLGVATAEPDGIISFGPIDFRRTDGTVTVVLTENLRTPILVDAVVFSTSAKVAIPAGTVDRSTGFASAGRAAAPVSVDGTDSEDAWRSSISLTGFRTMNGAVPAAEETGLRILWDEQNLYLAFRGTSYSLRRLSNDFGSFRKNVMQNDDDGIFYDDCFVFVIHDRVGKHLYDFAVNANGVILDSRMPVSEPWKHRDKKWNSGATVKTSIGEGFWQAEAAIPWRALGLRPAEGAEFGFCAGRYDSKNKETVTWQPCSAGYHNPAEYGTLCLAGLLPRIDSIRLPDFQSAAPVWRCVVGTGQALRLEQHTPTGWTEHFLCGDAVAAVKNDTPPRFYYYILTAPETGKCLLRSPAYNPASGVQNIVCSAAAAAYVNGRPFVKSTGSLREGLNVLAVRVAGAPMPEFQTGGETIKVDSTWRYSEKVPDNWIAPDFDDSKWAVGGNGKPGFYRKKLVLNGSMIWPNWQQKQLHINAGMVQELGLCPMGIPGTATPDGYRVIFEFSDQLELLGASGCFHFNPCRTEVIQGRPGFRTYAVTLPHVKRYNSGPMSGYQMLKLFVRAGTGASGCGTIRFHAETPDHAVTELVQTIPVKILPPLHPGRLNSIFFQLWVSGENALNDTVLQEKVYRAVFSTGINELHAPAAVDAADAQKWIDKSLPGHYFATVSMGNWGILFKNFLKLHPEWYAISGDGRKDELYCCPRLLKTPEGIAEVKAEFNRWFARNKHARHVQWDYEESIWSSRFTCYCPECLKEFAATYQLKRIPTGQKDIREKYPDQWIDFNCRRFADTAELLGTLCRKAGVKFSVYSGYQSEFSRANYGVDWRYLAGKIDLAMTGYGLSGTQLRPTLDALGSTPLVNSLILRPHAVGDKSYPTAISTAKIIQTVADGTGNGVMFYYYPTLDGRTFTAIAEASTLLARYEKYFIERRRVAPWKFSGALQTYFFGSERGELAVLLNLSDKPVICRLTTPENAESIYKIAPGQSVFAENAAGLKGNKNINSVK